MVAFSLPCLLVASSLKSDNNFLYSFYKPNAAKFIKHAKSNYLSNKRLQQAYDQPAANEVNSFLYAVAMDSIYSDGSDEIFKFFEVAAFSTDKIFGYFTMPIYMDFLIRTNRFSKVDEIESNMCGREAPQCNYYKLISKHLQNKKITKSECKDAYVFREMHKVVKKICK